MTKLFFFFCILFCLMLSIGAATGQEIQLDTCVNLAEFPEFELQQNVSETEQIYQQINIERLRSNRPAYGYSTSLSTAAAAIAGMLIGIPADEPIPETSTGDQLTQGILESTGYERWPDDNGFIVETTRSVHGIGEQSVDDIVDTLFGKVGNRGSVQDNALSMLESLNYREIGLAIITRPSTREKVIVVLAGARPNQFPVVVNFGGTTITQYGSVLSFHNETNRPRGSASPSILGRIESIGLRNPVNGEDAFSTVSWRPFCAWYPSNFGPGESIEVEMQFTDLNGQQVITRTSEWTPSGEAPIASPESGGTPTPTPTDIQPTPPTEPPVAFDIEAETYCTGGSIMQRGKASAALTVLVNTSQTLVCSVNAATSGEFTVEIRYSNDQGGGGAELLALSLNGQELEPILQAVNTRQPGETPGEGWNNFYLVPYSDTPSDQVVVALTQGESYALSIAVSAGDGYGVEIDRIRFTPR